MYSTAVDLPGAVTVEYAVSVLLYPAKDLVMYWGWVTVTVLAMPCSVTVEAIGWISTSQVAT